MEKKDLISFVEFVKNIKENRPDSFMSMNGLDSKNATDLEMIFRHQSILSLELSIGMFIPCDIDGNPIDKWKCNQCGTDSIDDCLSVKECNSNEDDLVAYEEALVKVLFYGYHLISNGNRLKRITFKTPDIGIKSIDFINGIAYKYRTVEDLEPLKLKYNESALKHYEI